MSEYTPNWERCMFGSHGPEQVRVIDEAIAAVRGKFADFDRFHPVMVAVARGFLPDLSETTPAAYFEALYFVAKFADFMAPVRQQVLHDAPADCKLVSEDSTVREDCGTLGLSDSDADGISSEKIALLAAAYTDLRKDHPDFDLLQPVMLHCAKALPSADWTLITLREYVECIFVVAKFSDFAQPLRALLVLELVPTAGATKM